MHVQCHATCKHTECTCVCDRLPTTHVHMAGYAALGSAILPSSLDLSGVELPFMVSWPSTYYLLRTVIITESRRIAASACSHRASPSHALTSAPAYTLNERHLYCLAVLIADEIPKTHTCPILEVMRISCHVRPSVLVSSRVLASPRHRVTASPRPAVDLFCSKDLLGPCLSARSCSPPLCACV
jgi:hypothetical protein